MPYGDRTSSLVSVTNAALDQMSVPLVSIYRRSIQSSRHRREAQEHIWKLILGVFPVLENLNGRISHYSTPEERDALMELIHASVRLLRILPFLTVSSEGRGGQS